MKINNTDYWINKYNEVLNQNKDLKKEVDNLKRSRYYYKVRAEQPKYMPNFPNKRVRI